MMKKAKATTRRSGSEDALKYLDKLRGGPLTLGAALHALRTGDEETQEAFAKRLGVSVQHLSDVEKGRRRVSVERAAKWAKALGHPAAVFVRLALQEELDAAGIKLKVSVAAA
jgi:transcriptional regulator with XRE-family HTH domain